MTAPEVYPYFFFKHIYEYVNLPYVLWHNTNLLRSDNFVDDRFAPDFSVHIHLFDAFVARAAPLQAADSNRREHA